MVSWANLETMARSGSKEVDETFVAVDRAEPIPPTDIVAYNELRSCADLVRLHRNGTLDVQPDFQREVVWKKDDQTRFIDSLVKRLPIPSMCFSLDYTTQEWKVIDGLQRMSSIINFLSEDKWVLSDLDDVHPLLRGKANTELQRSNDTNTRRLLSTVLDMSIPITVIRCDYTKTSHMEYLFTIFHRLNSGGVRLNNQEIRNCIYSGPFNDLLKNFDATNSSWKAVKRAIWGRMDRFRPVEILLRTLAFNDRLDAYDGNLARFLNQYMHDMSQDQNLNYQLIEDTLAAVAENAAVALQNLRGKVSLTVVESALVGILSNLTTVQHVNAGSLLTAFDKMLQANEFTEAARYAITSEKNVKARLDIARDAFAGI
ncbi:DUF262 domain-containing protein [Rhizobium brockwellii]|uniref:DUF262 domain-containing protein n=1 Tax=Rhizobium brockwellii TaxID=3019932 RepID=A0ABU3YFQ4_9HYPH|nr:DUF262 domain-containing protein [Rhizobium brockwellii]MDV4177685.1 DUF262 domain-containing protein [Rhizobium brockwellii]MDV4184684.1 DUF262 domain-containing protein [Rhizobium brockwellii]